MRLLFLILLLANVGAIAYIRSAESAVGAEAQISLLQISPEKVKLLKPKATAPENREKSGAASPQALMVCLEWGTFAADGAALAAAALAKLGLGDKLSQREAGDSYGVFILPFKTRAEADKKGVELKALGVADFYVVENDPARFAVALGVFKTEEAANNHLAQLKQRGVRSAVVTPRGAKTTLFVVRDPGDAVAAKIAGLKTDFPAATLKATTCPDMQQAMRTG